MSTINYSLLLMKLSRHAATVSSGVAFATDSDFNAVGKGSATIADAFPDTGKPRCVSALRCSAAVVTSYLCSMTLAARIDHTLLRPDATEQQIAQLCDEAAAHGFAAVCVPPCYVALVAAQLAGTGVAVATVIGFPLGYATSSVKFKEAEVALYDGATELDMVINISALKSGQSAAIQAEILDLADLCHVHQALLKVIIETALLTEAEMVLACQLCVAGEADFVKTSTGFASRGASVADVELLRRSLPAAVRIKAAGGIRTRAAALALVAAGADRIGSSNSIALIAETDDSTAA